MSRASLWRARDIRLSSKCQAVREPLASARPDYIVRATEQHRSYYGATSTLPPTYHIKFATEIQRKTLIVKGMTPTIKSL